MVDIDINHAGTEECVTDMVSLARQMASSVDELIGQLTPLAQSFQGAAATAFQDISRQRQQINQELNQSFSAGSGVLNNMHETMKSGDNKAASVIS
jgi:uncharacterized protein YukE